MSNIERIRVPDHLPEPMSQYTDAVFAGGWVYVSGILAVDKALLEIDCVARRP